MFTSVHDIRVSHLTPGAEGHNIAQPYPLLDDQPPRLPQRPQPRQRLLRYRAAAVAILQVHVGQFHRRRRR